MKNPLDLVDELMLESEYLETLLKKQGETQEIEKRLNEIDREIDYWHRRSKLTLIKGGKTA